MKVTITTLLNISYEIDSESAEEAFTEARDTFATDLIFNKGNMDAVEISHGPLALQADGKRTVYFSDAQGEKLSNKNFFDLINQARGAD